MVVLPSLPRIAFEIDDPVGFADARLDYLGGVFPAVSEVSCVDDGKPVIRRLGRRSHGVLIDDLADGTTGCRGS